MSPVFLLQIRSPKSALADHFSPCLGVQVPVLPVCLLHGNCKGGLGLSCEEVDTPDHILAHA